MFTRELAITQPLTRHVTERTAAVRVTPEIHGAEQAEPQLRHRADVTFRPRVPRARFRPGG